MIEYQLRYINSSGNGDNKSELLRFNAFNGKTEQVYYTYKKLSDTEQQILEDKYILYETVKGCLNKITDLRAQNQDLLVDKELKFLKHILDRFILISKNSKGFSIEYYKSILIAADEFSKSGEHDTALYYLQEVISPEINNYPDLRQNAYFKMARIYLDKNDLDSAYSLLIKLISKPYLITNRKSSGELVFHLSSIALKKGYIQQYKQLLFFGLRLFYTNLDQRKIIFEQIRITYKRSIHIPFNNSISNVDKIFYLVHWLYFKIPLRLRLKHITKFFLGIIYIINFTGNGNFTSWGSLINSSNEKIKTNGRASKKILITRAMGGIGDLLMMTPGIHALKLKYPDYQIHLAIPRKYFPLFEGNKAISVIDIESELLSLSDYDKWYNLSDCPAARIESRTSPQVKKDRIRIFSNALGVRNINFNRIEKRPRYFIKEDEISAAENFWIENKLAGNVVIGVQLHSEESYRDFPMMEELIQKISSKYKVIVFDSKPITGCHFSNVIKVEGMPLRNAIALVSRCDLIIAPDSSFIHLAAAFKIPSIGLFGPIDGKVRTVHYPECTIISSDDMLDCLPCWRNESIPCKLTGMRESICMRSIPVNKVLIELEIKLVRFRQSQSGKTKLMEK